MSIATEIERLQRAKQTLTTALLRKGIIMPSGATLDGYAEYIDPITKGEELTYLPKDQNYLTFKFVTDGAFYWKSEGNISKTIQYSKNGGSWTSVTSSSNGYVCDIVKGDEIWIKGTQTAYAISNTVYCYFFNTAKAYISGNVNSLINFSNTLSTNYTFCSLFKKNFNIDIDLNQQLLLPATTLANSCYYNMFSGCNSLTTAPELPATALTNYCYYSMFSGCNSLITAPELPATTLTNNCYDGMFLSCTNLTTASELPATALATYCYQNMFSGCTALTTAPVLPATALTNYCYYSMFSGCNSLTTAPELPATTLADYCYGYMFSGCISLTTAPELPATALSTDCYANMFSDCTSLTTAPELPATTLASSCYDSMFYGCSGITASPLLPATTLVASCYRRMFYYTSVSQITCLATDISASNCTTDWIYTPVINGTFIKNRLMSSWPSGTSGIPNGWDVTDYTG